MVAKTAGRSTRRWKTKVRPAILGASDVCHWCGHPGANDVDHHPIPYSVLALTAPEHLENPDYCRPIHGVEGCPVCPPRNGKPRRCNQEKGDQVNAVPPARASRQW